jgi:hypothetical protein
MPVFFSARQPTIWICRNSIKTHQSVYEIGRKTKKEFLCTNKLDGSQILMILIEKDLSKLIPKNEKSNFLSLMRELTHPLIDMVAGCDLGTNRCVIYHKWNTKGSLRDFIYKANPLYAYSTKYTHGIPLLPKYITYFGKQILLALKALDTVGIRFCVSTGNILLCGNQIKLTEIENHFLQMPHPYENWIRKNPVLSFGHVMFEMVTGAPLESDQLHDLDKFPIEKSILKVLKSIFDGKYYQIENILEEPIFADLSLDPAFIEQILNIGEKKKMFF